MGLPPSLLDYAENIWRRFPEAFFALGVPQLEDVFEVKEGSWRYRIVDTDAEKVVEIVLPRRKKERLEPRAGSFFKSEEVENHSSLPSACKASNRPESSLQGVLWDSGQQRLGDKIATRAAKLGLDISTVQKSIKECVSREIQSQLREIQPRKDSSTLGCKLECPDSSGSLSAAENGRHISSMVDTSPTGSNLSWASSLAARRGLRKISVDIKCIDNKDGGPDSVKRAPLLARSAFEQDGNEQMPHEQDGSLLHQPHHQVALADSSPPGAEPAEALSPGTELMMCARRGKERQGGDKLEKLARSRGADTHGEADEADDTSSGVDEAPDADGFEMYWKSVNSGKPG